MRSPAPILIADARHDPVWRDSADVEIGMISYLGYPIRLSAGDLFGTLCVFDRRPNTYGSGPQDMMRQFCDVLEGHLALIAMNDELETRNRELSQALAEVKTLRGIIPICSHCKRVRDDAGFWENVDLLHLAPLGSRSVARYLSSLL